MEPSSSSLPAYAFALPLVLTGGLALRYLRRRNGSYGLPPGPKGIPFFGSALSVNAENPLETFMDWSRQYGDIMHCRIFSRDFIFLNTERAAQDLLERRSRLYSDRSGFDSLEDYGVLLNTGTVRYGPTWRFHRKLYSHIMRESVTPNFHAAQYRKASELLSSLSTDPPELRDNLDTFSVGIVLSILYGDNIEHRQELEKDIAKLTSTCADRFKIVASDIVVATINALPFMKYAPAWLFGGIFNAAESRKINDALVDGLYERLVVADAVQLLDQRTDHLDEASIKQSIKHVCATSFLAGMETTTSALLIFVLAMLQNPEVQRRGQEEIDHVVGKDRLPTFEDRESMPYLEAVMRETLRWRSVVPTGVPHCLTEDDVYEGYFFPKGSVVIGHTGAISHDESRYPSPSTFLPERFILPDGTLNDDTVSYAFGFGRRMCPGRHLATSSVWIAIASILASFRIEHPKDERGRVLRSEPKWEVGLTCQPHFKCEFVPREHS
ncbi:cytochrome P450 [Coniophora puteana RWD-64-598 SS2]|uniref:Cytochrome P450 n=1 Tax=Coniophora puteana (strain RWD-64-598) TaxID=741705 RepID=A0A5M3N3S2_CONPW|nr:cytochrome P450 [Coniophora puteana RWD-64-598 SS2]EIW85664.1 cytochrome P450 [Coniophora puteana RWD-64-598 SS2]